MIKINNLRTNLKDSELEILQGVNLNIEPGKINLVMGPNGSGKSSLAYTLAGHPAYEVTSGSVMIDDENLLDMDPSERSLAGLFLAFQYPVEVPGVNFFNFLRLAYNSRREEKVSVFRFKKILKEKSEMLKIKSEFLDRNLNEGFSGGEKKKMEILQMAVLKPKYIILDETDSGLDVDALKDVFTNIGNLITEDGYNPGLLVITHYHRVLDFLKPDEVNIMKDGKIIETGDVELAKKINSDGYRF